MIAALLELAISRSARGAQHDYERLLIRLE